MFLDNNAARVTKGSTPPASNKTTAKGVDRDPFVDPVHPSMPESMPVWADALARSRDAGDPLRRWEYLYPDPALFVSGNPDRTSRYFGIWLAFRFSWVALHEYHGDKLVPFTTQEWREILNLTDGHIPSSDKQTMAAQRLRKIKAALDRITTILGEDDAPVRLAPPFYYDSSTFRSGDQIPTPLRQKILWEIYQLGFETELLAIDRHVCPPSATNVASQSGEDLLRRIMINRIFNKDTTPPALTTTSCIPSVPPLCDRSLRNRVPSLEAFRQVLIRWPNSPRSLSQSAPLTHSSMSEAAIQACERVMVRYYCQMFWLQAGRAPLVPHFFPTID